MCKKLNKLALSELRNYRGYKKTVADMSAKKQAINERLVKAILMVACVEAALGHLSEEVREYARLRYLSDEESKHASIVADIGVSERTLSRWNEQLISEVARQLGLLRRACAWLVP